MKRPGFFQGVVVAGALALLASVIAAALAPLIGVAAVVRLTIPLLSLVYLLYLFRCSGEKVGRVTTLSLWLLFALCTWWLGPPLPLYLAVHVGAVWLVRSLYFYAGIFPALLDAGLSLLSLAAAVWAISHSGSLFLATWCLFLVQALFVSIPPRIGRRPSQPQSSSQSRSFDHARRNAEQALQQLFTQ